MTMRRADAGTVAVPTAVVGAAVLLTFSGERTFP